MKIHLMLLNGIFAVIRIIFYIPRIIWSNFLYPAQFAFGKTEKEDGRFIANSGSHKDAIWLYVPGNCEVDLKHKRILPHFPQDNTPIEVVPAPSYERGIFPFSLNAWKNRIVKRVKSLRKEYTTVYCYGFSMGGAALALASKDLEKENTQGVYYAIANSFNSLPNLFWYKPEFAIIILTLHLLPAAVITMFFGIHSSKSLLAGLILITITLSSFICSFVYLAFRPLYQRLPHLHRKPHINLLRFAIVRYSWHAFAFIVYKLFTIVYMPYRLLAHLFIRTQLWLLQADQNISKNLSTQKVFVFQAEKDEIIPKKARLATHFKGQIHTESLEHDFHPFYDVQAKLVKIAAGGT